MKKLVLPVLFLFYIIILIICIYVSYHPKQKQMNISVKMEITGRGYFQYGKDTRLRDDYFSRVSITNHEDSTIIFWTMSCSWMDNVLKFNQDSLEFSTGNCTKDIPVKVELKPGKTIIFYPVFTDISKKRYHPFYSDFSRNNKQVRIGFILMRNVSKDPYGEQPQYIRPGNIFWSNPVSLDFRNNKFRITENN